MRQAELKKSWCNPKYKSSLNAVDGDSDAGAQVEEKEGGRKMRRHSFEIVPWQCPR